MAKEIGKPVTQEEAERLHILAEESAEIIQIVGKILRFGYESSNPLKAVGKIPARSNRSLLEMELGHHLQIKTMMLQAGDMRAHNIILAAELKHHDIGHWLRHQDIPEYKGPLENAKGNPKNQNQAK